MYFELIFGFLGSWDNFVSWISPWNFEKNSKNVFMGLEIFLLEKFFF